MFWYHVRGSWWPVGCFVCQIRVKSLLEQTPTHFEQIFLVSWCNYIKTTSSYWSSTSWVQQISVKEFFQAGWTDSKTTEGCAPKFFNMATFSHKPAPCEPSSLFHRRWYQCPPLQPQRSSGPSLLKGLLEVCLYPRPKVLCSHLKQQSSHNLLLVNHHTNEPDVAVAVPKTREPELMSWKRTTATVQV